jgi:hypothetical protein
MTGCKPISIPLEQNVKLSADEGHLVEDTIMYRHIVGNLIYMTITRLDLSNWNGKSIHVDTTKATFGCSEVHTEVHKIYFVVWNFL